MFDGMNLTENAVKLTSISIDKIYLMYCISTQFVQERFISRFHQVAQPKLSIETSLKTIIPIPSLSEQKRIVSIIEDAFTIIDNLEENKQSLEQVIKQSKSKVLDLAIRGKLVLQDSNDEPASILLERIRAEQKKAGKKVENTFDNSHYPELPRGWIIAQLSDICVYERGITFPSSAKQMSKSCDSIACVRTANVQEILELDDLWYIDKKYIKNNSTKLLRDGDIIMSTANSRELVGKTSYVETVQQEMTFGGFVMVIRTQQIDSKYIFYLLRSMFGKGLFANGSTQTTNIANINTVVLGNFSILIPPLEEQKRIVKKIETTFQILDSIQNNI
ncbi:Type I restriction enzyme EcoKI specificity protein [Bacteroidales bacterium Barb4]|nr:Type I restriction enzyme EcoKI specificity protein [Bacteroidales bacterium Barb4]